MRIRIPAYFDKFKCLADKCTDTCCAGWDVYVDGETVKKYRELSCDMGERIRSSLEQVDGEVRIRSASGRCPFLNETGLCDIISCLGESYISEICTEHPRYYLTLGERVFAGLGASCEEAARLILTEDGEHRYVEREAVGFLPSECDGELYTAVYAAYLASVDAAVREYSIIDAALKICRIAEKLDKNINGEFSNEILHAPLSIDKIRAFIQDVMNKLEYMGRPVMERVIRALDSSRYIRPKEYIRNALLYFLDRYYLTVAEDADVMGTVGFILFSTAAVSLSFGNDAEQNTVVFKDFSAEVEYDEDNVDVIKNLTRDGVFTHVLPIFDLFR